MKSTSADQHLMDLEDDSVKVNAKSKRNGRKTTETPSRVTTRRVTYARKTRMGGTPTARRLYPRRRGGHPARAPARQRRGSRDLATRR